MTISLSTSEGHTEGPHGQTWWRITGELELGRHSGRAPVVVLHGGPGVPHNYLLRLAQLSDRGRAVIHYDQIGSGRSTHLPNTDPEFWTVELFLDELTCLLNDLGIADDYYLLGQSWGGMLAAEHALSQSPGLRGMILANTPASMPLWVAGVNQLRSELPAAVQETLSSHESNGTTDSAEYLGAQQVFYDRHVCRMVPNPPELMASFEAVQEDPTVYHAMVGPNEFYITGSLKSWSVVDQLHRITVPTLVVNGRYDEATDLCVAPFLQRIPRVQYAKFEHSSHTPHLEEEELFLDVVNAFLESCDDPRA
ncbi:proline iminopeptidase-family hydrolase [Mycobacterium haemophilum]|uniref:Proline iminopeptidase n=1 Tax=Mycobacterium haemophilum TaxID=29311 RepID=A0A0I9U013_9MYCO|nr:proline iminopeptidase-family hydrolase [Mycobacterium haemophilum]KLO25441.1 amino acid amidase [Mycobacterium haemophilum]KLO34160.1 amino acid amidase [Mycobacterium haemophilum]KLO37025.1 amino acid amidase [Mycobacterium haemophilum]KLO43327.1 amino acid amidase [Mycobacterium haemophilum]